MSSVAGSDSADLRLCPPHLLQRTYVLIKPPHTIAALVFLGSCSLIPVAVTSSSLLEREANSLFFNFSFGPRLHQQIPPPKKPMEALGLWFSYFVKQRRALCLLSSWFRGLLLYSWTDIGEQGIQQNDLWPLLKESLMHEPRLKKHNFGQPKPHWNCFQSMDCISCTH